MVTRRPRCVSTWSNSRPTSCSATSLKASVGPWNSSISQRPAVDLLQRHHRLVAEAGIGFGRQAREIVLRDGVAEERLHDAGGQCRIVEPGQRREIELRPGFRQIEAAVAGEARQQDLVEGEHGRGASSAEISQGAGNLGGSKGRYPIARRPARQGGHNLLDSFAFFDLGLVDR